LKVKLLIFCAIILIGSSTLLAKSSVLVFLTDLYNQVSIKPQETGSMIEFAIGTVSVDGRMNEDPKDRFKWLVKEINSSTATANPIELTALSLSNGKLKFNTYCNVCHSDTTKINEEGFADTKANKLGMLAPALIPLTPGFTDGYLYNKIKHGGAVMPSLGYATTDGDKWDIINYIRQLEKGI